MYIHMHLHLHIYIHIHMDISTIATVLNVPDKFSCATIIELSMSPKRRRTDNPDQRLETPKEGLTRRSPSAKYFV